MKKYFLTLAIIAVVIVVFISVKNGSIGSFDGFQNLLPMNIHSSGSSGSGDKKESTIAPYTLLDYYPVIDPSGKLGDKSAQDLWWHYPTFKVGSYDQITNNIRYPDNPDVGQCQPESMCNVIYGDRQEHSNYITPLGEAPSSGVRINYYSTTTPPFF